MVNETNPIGVIVKEIIKRSRNKISLSDADKKKVIKFHKKNVSLLKQEILVGLGYFVDDEIAEIRKKYKSC